MADSKINAFTPLSLFEALAGTQTYVTVTDKSSFENMLFSSEFRKKAIVFSNWAITNPFPVKYGSGIILPLIDWSGRVILYMTPKLSGEFPDMYYGWCSKQDDNITYVWQKINMTSV